jgi:hypothetical protein
MPASLLTCFPVKSKTTSLRTTLVKYQIIRNFELSDITLKEFHSISISSATNLVIQPPKTC